MAVIIRLARHGAKKAPYYRIVAAEKTKKRDGRFIELLGTYNPLLDPGVVQFKEERVKAWLNVGAQTSDTVRRLIQKSFPGLVEARTEAKLKKVRAARTARKERAKARGGAKPAAAAKSAAKAKK